MNTVENKVAVPNDVIVCGVIGGGRAVLAINECQLPHCVDKLWTSAAGLICSTR